MHEKLAADESNGSAAAISRAVVTSLEAVSAEVEAAIHFVNGGGKAADHNQFLMPYQSAMDEAVRGIDNHIGIHSHIGKHNHIGIFAPASLVGSFVPGHAGRCTSGVYRLRGRSDGEHTTRSTPLTLPPVSIHSADDIVGSCAAHR